MGEYQVQSVLRVALSTAVYESINHFSAASINLQFQTNAGAMSMTPDFFRCAVEMTFNGFTILGGITSITDFDVAEDNATRTMLIANIQHNGKSLY